MKIQSQGRFFYVELPNGQILAKYDYDELLMNINKLGFDIDKNQNESITLDGKNHYFLCSWNGTECVQIHTKETLIKEYKDTNLFDGNDWGHGHFYGSTFLELLDDLIENNDVLNTYTNDNMSIQYIKEKE